MVHVDKFLQVTKNLAQQGDPNFKVGLPGVLKNETQDEIWGIHGPIPLAWGKSDSGSGKRSRYHSMARSTWVR